MTAKQDYYKVLGVSRSADEDAIRTAHRKLARTYHPDINKDEGAAAKFSEIQEAYDVLSDTEKRAQYDQYGHRSLNTPPHGAGVPGGWSNVDADTFEDIFGSVFGGHRRGSSGFGDFGTDFNAPRGPGKGNDTSFDRDISFATAALGGTEELRITGNDGEPSTINVPIPAGTNDGATLRIRGKGNPGANGGPPGDLLLRIRVGDHPWFKREGLDLSVDVPISITESALGGKVAVPLLQGSAEIPIPPGVTSGARLRLKGKGITNAKGTSGHLFAVIEIVAPSDLSNEDKETLQALAPNLPNPRATVAWAADVTD